MDALQGWLDALGLGQYGPVLRAQDITLDLLADLTVEDLALAGVASVGHRRRILTAAAAQRAPGPPVVAKALAEQRIVTALFCDLVGSTHLSTVLDPEEYRDLIARFRALVAEALRPYDGHVARFLGDGIVVFFGLTRTEEHTAENAVAAGLEILQRLRAVEPVAGHPPQVRIGIATGMTVVGRPGQGLSATEDPVVGEIPNLAARLQAATEPGGILVSQATRERLGHLFRCEDAGVLALKGVSGGLRAWRILGHADTDSRFDALRAANRGTGFVGREGEMRRLAEQAAAARSGQGRVSVITGEPGMGKSRLAREALIAAGFDPARQVVLQGTPYHAGTPFHPLRRHIGRRLGPAQGADPTAVAGFLADHGLSGARATELLAGLMSDSVAAPADPRAAMGIRVELIALLSALFTAVAATAGAVIVEDLQWIDPSTSEVLARIGAGFESVGAHLICTMRPGPLPGWCLQAGAMVVPLDRLREAEFGQLIRAVARVSAPAVAVSETQVAEIAARCDGSPVFAEELTRYMLEAMADGRTPDAQALPATLADSLLARLDRLAAGRRLAQLGAVIGNEFPVAFLYALADLPEAEVRRGIEALIEAGVLQVGHSAFGPAVGFRHMLLQDAAYLTLLRRDRVALHARIAASMQTQFPEISAALPQVLAHHLSRAGDGVQAAAQWDRAGTMAARRSAYSEATGLFRRALDDLAAVRDAPDLERLELGVRLNLVAALIASHGFNAPAVRAEMPKVEALGAALKSTDQLLPLLVSKWVFMGASGQYAASLDVARQIRGMTAEGSAVERLLGHRAWGTSLLFAGRIDEARRELTAFFALHDPALHGAGLDRFGTSNHAVMSAVGMTELAVLAEDDTAAEHWAQRAEALAGASGQAHDLCNVTLFIGCVLPAMRGRHDLVSAAAGRLRALAQDHALPMWAGYADLFHGIGLMGEGQIEAGHPIAARGIAQTEGTSAFLTFCLMFHAEVSLQAGLTAEARDSFRRIGAQSLTQETWLSADLARLDALIALQEGAPPEAVRTGLAQALALAQRQGAPLFARKITEALQRL